MSDARLSMIKRAAREIRAGMTVNLGIGYPTQVVNYLEPNLPVWLHSENGIVGVGPALPYEEADPNLIDAGGQYISEIPGTSYMDSAVSFSLVRSGRLDLTILGAFEVAMNGDLANWIIPGRFTPGAGGAVELAQKACRVVVLTTHRDKQGRSKIVKNCSLPLTAKNCVKGIYTDMAVMEVVKEGLLLKEIAKEVSLDEVIAATDAPLILPDAEIPRF